VRNDEVKSLVLREIQNIAPETEVDQIDPTVSLREQVDLDSMDILNLMVAIHEATGVDIPEADYPRIATIDACVAYLSVRMKKG
jgi:acyl carrier protein